MSHKKYAIQKKVERELQNYKEPIRQKQKTSSKMTDSNLTMSISLSNANGLYTQLKSSNCQVGLKSKLKLQSEAKQVL